MKGKKEIDLQTVSLSELLLAHRKAAIKEVVDDFNRWFEAQSWDINSGAYIIPKLAVKMKLAQLKERWE